MGIAYIYILGILFFEEFKMIDIVVETKLIANYIKNLRKYFHMYPELSMQEFKTSKKIQEELKKINVPYLNEVKTEVIASIGNNQGRTIALRCDMDGLKITENTGVPYASINKGIMHACGHDAHGGDRGHDRDGRLLKKMPKAQN